MNLSFFTQLLLCVVIATTSVVSHANDWRLGVGIGPNFSQIDLIDDELESDIGFSIWGDYFFNKKWFGHLAYDYFKFDGDPIMNSGLLGIGYEFDRWGRRWFPYAIVGAGVSQIQDFPVGIKDQTALSLNFRPGLEYAMTPKWFVGFSYEYVHVIADGSDNGVDVALPFISLTYRPNRFTEKKKSAEPVATDKDSDRDGVPDSRDACPKTPRGTEVDENGCELEDEETKKDDDGDKVVNAYDQCPNTPRGRS